MAKQQLQTVHALFISSSRLLWKGAALHVKAENAHLFNIFAYFAIMKNQRDIFQLVLKTDSY